ncbi:MAG: NAD(P)H-hydrate dehydratase [Lachnospiraceae bacterium]|nr:NAD(P)H-hydrate dehydratase [Lachnospiraceae bacterium]
MKGIVTAAEMKSYDNYTISEVGVPSMVLMERAALSVVKRMETLFIRGKAKVCICCGVGNNGADGLAIARMLAEKGCEVYVYVFGKPEKATTEFAMQQKILESYPVQIFAGEAIIDRDYDVVVDALFGVGLTRSVEGEFAEAIHTLNTLKGYKVAVDIPSGVSADTGEVLGCPFKADITVTFAFGKRGLYFYPGADYAGEIFVEDIGIGPVSNPKCNPTMYTYEKSDIERLLPGRKGSGNKGTFGKVLIVAGFEYMVGAAILCARACYEMGAGMVKVICPEENRMILQHAVPEILYGTCEDLDSSLKWADVVVVGPGMGCRQMAREILLQLLEKCELPMVVDADALNMLSVDKKLQDALYLRGDKGLETVLTPHMGEFARLAGSSVEDLKADTAEAASNWAKAYQIILAAKDARTVVADGSGRLYLNCTGNSGMATAGSGDVLAGIIGSLLAQGLSGFDGAALGVYIHSLAGDEAADKYSEYGVTAGKIIENVKGIIADGR